MDSRHRSRIKIITWDECEDCKCPKNPYHEKNGCEKKKAEIIANETQENCSQGKTKNI